MVPSKISILVIDDDPRVRDSLREFLEHAGYRVECAADGVEADTVLESFSPAVIICDLYMPNKDGIATIRDIRAKDKAVKVIAASGGPPPGGGPDLADALRAGADMTLAKPFRLRQLLKAVSSLIDTAAPDASS